MTIVFLPQVYLATNLAKINSNDDFVDRSSMVKRVKANPWKENQLYEYEYPKQRKYTRGVERTDECFEK